MVRPPRCRLGFVVVAACGASGDAGSYTRALVEAGTYEEAAGACRRIADSDARGDCLNAAMERWNTLDEAECRKVDDPLWRDECMFLLAERRLAAGDLAAAIGTCHRTRFSRSCSWHLLREEVDASLDDPPAEAEKRLTAFAEADPLPDAAFQFWLIRFRAATGKDSRPTDERECEGLSDAESCRHAVQTQVRTMLDATGRADLARVCAAAPGARVTSRGRPAWVTGPVASEAEARWVAERCPPAGAATASRP